MKLSILQLWSSKTNQYIHILQYGSRWWFLWYVFLYEFLWYLVSFILRCFTSTLGVLPFFFILCPCLLSLSFVATLLFFISMSEFGTVIIVIHSYDVYVNLMSTLLTCFWSVSWFYLYWVVIQQISFDEVYINISIEPSFSYLFCVVHIIW